jgi:two-component system NtrC family sensor kinase
MATFFVMQGRDRGKRFDLRRTPLTIGRDESNQIRLNDSEVSRRHAEIRGSGDEIELLDLSSSNGAYVNNEKVSQHLLRTGDQVLLGRTLLLFTAGGQPEGEQLAHQVDIRGQAGGPQGSRIVRALKPDDGSRLFSQAAPTDSPWLVRARNNLQIIYRTARAVSHTLDINELLQRILQLIFEWVEADRGCVVLYDHETGQFTPAASRSRPGASGDGRFVISRTILDYVLEQQEGVITSDAREDARWDAANSIVQHGVREAICVPLQGRYGTVGAIYIDTQSSPIKSLASSSFRGPTRFQDDHLKLMVAIGCQAALAVEDTSYYSALLQSERLAAMGQTIATLSHHVKNILQGIRGGSYLIEEGLKQENNEVVRKGWRIVDKNQERISNLVMDMLTFSKDREPDLCPAQLNEVVGDVVELLQVRAKEAGVQLDWAPHANLPEFKFDADLMHRAVLNVVGNAIDACEKREAAAVTVHLERDPAQPHVDIVVEDNGEGIAPEDLQKIFSVFESRKGARGTGLGLPVSQKILREHGGEVLVESAPGVGSRFTLRLPARQCEAEHATIVEPPK